MPTDGDRWVRCDVCGRAAAPEYDCCRHEKLTRYVAKAERESAVSGAVIRGFAAAAGGAGMGAEALARAYLAGDDRPLFRNWINGFIFAAWHGPQTA